MDKKEPSPLVEAGIEQQACLGLYRFHEAVIDITDKQLKKLIENAQMIAENKKAEAAQKKRIN